MRWLLGVLFILALGAVGGYIFVKGYPYRLYSGWIEGKNWDRFYSIEDYRKLYLAPSEMSSGMIYTEDYPQLWKNFQLRNAQIPLPTRHPLYVTIPLVEFQGKTKTPVIGMIIAGPEKREISRLYTVPVSLSQDYTQGQELFKLPFVKKRIMAIPHDEIWKDIFTRKISPGSKPLEEMIRDLYILHIRSRLLPPATIRYGILKDGKAVIELASRDKDYKLEIILTQQNGTIYSYIIRTAPGSQESLKLRSKFLSSISFSPLDPDLGRILYTEFKALNYARQVDQEGLLYLYSAWTQDFEQIELLKEMIFFLERGKGNQAQLKQLYYYAFKKYGKTFTTRNLLTETDDQDLLVQRKTEIESIEKKQELDREASKVPVQPELTSDEKMREHLKKAKEEGPTQSEDVTVH